MLINYAFKQCFGLCVLLGLVKEVSHFIAHQQHPSLGPFVCLELEVQMLGCDVLDLADHQTRFRSLLIALVGLPSSQFFFKKLTPAFQDLFGWTIYDRLVEVGLVSAVRATTTR